MESTFTFSEAERQLLLELLQGEHRELGPEIRHTDNRGVRDELRERQQMVMHVLERLQGIPVK